MNLLIRTRDASGGKSLGTSERILANRSAAIHPIPVGYNQEMPFRHDPNTLWPTSLVDWLVILMLGALLVAMLWPAIAF